MDYDVDIDSHTIVCVHIYLCFFASFVILLAIIRLAFYGAMKQSETDYSMVTMRKSGDSTVQPSHIDPLCPSCFG